MISLSVSEDHYLACPNATEKWLIMNRTKLTIPAEAMICPKHRLMVWFGTYGLGWKSLMPCQYHHPVSKPSSSDSEVTRALQNAVSSASSVNTKVQLLSILYGKSDDTYESTIGQILQMLPGSTRRQINKARKHASMRLSGIPIEPGKFIRVKVIGGQIHHFLDFIQFSGLVQDVASGTRTVKLSSNDKISMQNVIRTVHKAEFIRLLEGACDKDGYNRENGRASTRTLWNIINNCPANQRRIMWHLKDNQHHYLITSIMEFIASKESDMKTKTDDNIKQLTNGKR